MEGGNLSYKDRSLTCPNCGFEFDLLYARAISCQSCRRLTSTLSCELVRCPNCDHEFPITRRAVQAIHALRRWQPHHPPYSF